MRIFGSTVITESAEVAALRRLDSGVSYTGIIILDLTVAGVRPSVKRAGVSGPGGMNGIVDD